MNEQEINIDELKKDIYRYRAQAIFDYYKEGRLYYRFSINKDIYRFPVDIVGGLPMQFTEDVGDTKFSAVEKASLLLRWIQRAHSNNELTKTQ